MTTSPRNTAKQLLRGQALGFSLIIVCVWLAEFAHLPHLLYNAPPEVDLPRGLLRTALVIAIWIWVHLGTRRLLLRLHELEDFLIMCSWCRRISHGDKWLTTEEFFGSQLHTGTSHGVCPACASQQLTTLRATRVTAQPPA